MCYCWNIKKLLKKQLITCCSRPPSGAIKDLNSYVENVFKKADTENKFCILVDNFNLNYLDFIKNLEVRKIYNQIFVHGYIPLITRPTRVTLKTISLIDNIFTNFIFGASLKPKELMIIKSDVSDYFPVFVSLNSSSKICKENKQLTIHKRVMHDTNLAAFKVDLCNVNWKLINDSPETS